MQIILHPIKITLEGFLKNNIYIYKLKKFLYFAAWKRGF